MGKVHFGVDFEGLTQLARDFWAEHNFDKARKLLIEGCDFENAVAMDIIQGRKKMAQHPDGKKGVDGIVVKDNWQPDLSECRFGKYPTLEDADRWVTLSIYYGADFLENSRQDIGELLLSYAISIDTIERSRIVKELKKYPSSLYKDLEIPYPITEGGYLIKREFVDLTLFPKLQDIAHDIPAEPPEYSEALSTKVHGYPEYSEILSERNTPTKSSDYSEVLSDLGVPSVEKYVKHQLELDKKPLPDPDSKARLGWISPDGKLYPCGWMEHGWLAERLGETITKTDTLGWILISHPANRPDDLLVFCDKESTQAQRDALRVWSKANNQDFQSILDSLTRGAE